MMCDYCCGALGDHDKPYRFGDVRATVARFTRHERQQLIMLRENVREVQHGKPFGYAWGDIAADGSESKIAEPESPDAD